MRPLRFCPAGVVLALLGLLALGGSPPLGPSVAQANADLPDDAAGVAMVQGVLDQGLVPGSPNRVRYGALAKDRTTLDKALAYIAETDPNLLPTDADRLAFWINAYNLSMINAILQHWGGERSYSVSKDGFSIFDKATHVVAGGTYSLNEIEHGVIRGDLGKVAPGTRGAAKAAHGAIWGGKPVDARVHMALNCASVGCPELRSKAYQGSTLNRSLNQQSRRYVKDPARGAGPEGISEIFKWYEGDFKAVGGPEGFIKGHRGDTEGVALERFISYDWTLNIK